MKLASLKQGRDGRLIVVDRALEKYVPAAGIADTMQDALDNWAAVSPKLHDLAGQLEAGRIDGAKVFDPKQCASPLPRAYQVADGSAYLNHVELVRKARGAEMPPEFRDDPLIYQGVSDIILGPCDPVPVPDESYGIDFEAEIAVITDDVPMGVSAGEAERHIKLVMLMNDVSLRNLIPNELGKGFGFFQSKPPSAFSPVAVTPDVLGDKWVGGKLNLPLVSTLNEKQIGHPDAGVDMQFSFAQLIAHAAKTRPLGAGTIIGSGTISNADPESGVSCLAEIRMIEKIETGETKTPFMKYGDRIRIEMLDTQGKTIFGAIEQEIVPYDHNHAAKQKTVA